MKYKSITSGIFISRPNRFIAEVKVCGNTETVHVKNTGRCKELLVPGCTVYLSASDNPGRRTKYDLVAVEKLRDDGSTVLVNIDSQMPNEAVAEWLGAGALFGKDAKIRREVRYGDSRFDFYVEYGERKAFLEVKGVTLEKDGTALFPDAPTERGVKHINELVSCVKDGYEAYIIFVIQMKGVTVFRPNDDTHREFGDALRAAEMSGVKILAIDCYVTEDSMKIDASVPTETGKALYYE